WDGAWCPTRRSSDLGRAEVIVPAGVADVRFGVVIELCDDFASERVDPDFGAWRQVVKVQLARPRRAPVPRRIDAVGIRIDAHLAAAVGDRRRAGEYAGGVGGAGRLERRQAGVRIALVEGGHGEEVLPA